MSGRPVKQIKKDPKDFTMITRGYIRDMRELSKRNPSAFQLLMILVERMNKANAVVISQATLGQILGYTRQTIYTAAKLLEAENWLQVVKVGTANAYVLNSKVVWRTHSDQRYGSFFAEVIVSEKEQGRSVESWDDTELRQIPVPKAGEILVSDDAPLPPPDQAELFPGDTSFLASDGKTQ